MASRVLNRFLYVHRPFLSDHSISPLRLFKFQSYLYSHAPQLLPSSGSLSQYRRQTLLANLLQKFGFPVSHLQQFLSKNHFLLKSNLSDVERSLEILLFSFKFSQDVLAALICSCPAVLELQFLKKWEAVTLDCAILGKSPQVIRSVIELSKKFQREPSDFQKCVQVLKDLKFSDDAISSVLREYPRVVMMNVNELHKHTAVLASLGLERDDINRIHLLCPEILGFGAEERLKPLLDEFSQMGFGRRILRHEILGEPRLLTLDKGELQRYLELLKKLKCRESIKEEIFSKGEMKAGFAVKLRVDLLRSYGLIHRDALNILRREPRTIAYGIEDIKRKIEFLLHTMKFQIGCVLDVPEYLGVHFDKQIVPRHNVIEYLRSRGGLGFEVSLRDIIKPSRLKFYNFYVKPYPECEKIYGRFSDYAEAKARHPPGLWKLLKPPQVPISADDAKNIKAFMER